MKPLTAAATFGILIYDNVEPIDLGGTLGVISMARRVLPAVDAAVIAPDPGPVRLSGGLDVLAPYGIATAPACDVVIVCGGPGWPEAAANTGLLAWLAKLPAEQVASVCTGAMILHAAGVLNGRTATTRRTALGSEPHSPLALLGQGGAVRTVEAAIVDNGVVTGGGVALGIDVTLHLLGRLYGADAAASVAQVLEYDRAWEANRAALGVVIE